MAVTFPGETDEHRQARDRLLTEEVELRRHMERVAEARRALPRADRSPRTTCSPVRSPARSR